jgi:hypothetical protein
MRIIVLGISWIIALLMFIYSGISFCPIADIFVMVTVKVLRTESLNKNIIPLDILYLYTFQIRPVKKTGMFYIWSHKYYSSYCFFKCDAFTNYVYTQVAIPFEPSVWPKVSHQNGR